MPVIVERFEITRPISERIRIFLSSSRDLTCALYSIGVDGSDCKKTGEAITGAISRVPARRIFAGTKSLRWALAVLMDAKLDAPNAI